MVAKTSRQVDQATNQRKVVVLTLLLLVALWSVVIVSTVSARRDSVAATSVLLQRMNRAVAEYTRQQFHLADILLTTCEHWLQANPGRDPLADPSFRKLVASFRAKTGSSIDLLLLADGQISSIPGEAGQPLTTAADSNSLVGAETSDGLFIGRPTHSPPSDLPGLPIALSLPNPADGVPTVVAVLNLATLTRVYEDLRQKPGGAITLLRRDGTVLARSPDDRWALGQSVAREPLFREHLTAHPEGLALLDKVADTPASEFVSYSSMQDFPLTITVSEDHDEALAPWLRQTLWMMLVAAGVTVPLGIIAYRSLRLLQALGNRNAALQQLATTDRLTGVSNRQHFLQTLDEAVGRARLSGSPLTVLIFEIDFFKRINDGYGHAVGDSVLTSFAEAANKCRREMDLLARFGGGEFSLMLPDTALEEALRVAAQVRSEIATIAIATENGVVQFTASIGASEARTDDSSLDDLLRRASKALHQATAGGHDQVVAI